MNSAKFLTILMILSLVGCKSTIDSPLENTPLHAQAKADGILYSFSILKAQFDVSETLTGTFEVVNQSGVERGFNFANIQQFGFKLTNPNGTVVLFYPQIVLPALSGFGLQPGEKRIFSLSHLFMDASGQYVDPSAYVLSAFLLDGNSPALNLSIQVK